MCSKANRSISITSPISSAIRIEGDTLLKPGKHTITYEFTYDGGGPGKGGTGTLSW